MSFILVSVSAVWERSLFRWHSIMLRKTLPLLRSKNIWAVRCEHELALHHTSGVGKKEIYLEVFQKETNTPKQKKHLSTEKDPAFKKCETI